MFPEDQTLPSHVKSRKKMAILNTNVATEKQKKKVLEAARLVNGAMKLAGSVQSLDAEVQQNMKRSNISADQIVDMALEAKINCKYILKLFFVCPATPKRLTRYTSL